MEEEMESDCKFFGQAGKDVAEADQHGLKGNRDVMDGASVNTDFVWEKYLEDSDLEAANTSAFSHVQQDTVSYTAGSVVEVVSENGDTAWPAHVTMVCDSLLRLRYVGGQGAAHDLWCDPAGGRLRPLGWGWQQGVPLVAPPDVIPADLTAKALSEVLPPRDGEQNQPASSPASRPGGVEVERISEGMKLEVLDEANPYHVWTATVLERCGVRLRLRRDTLDDTPDLWLCVSSPRVRHFGWAARAGDPFTYRPPTECAADRTQAEWEAILEMSRDEARQMAVDDTILPYTKYEFPLKHGVSVGCRLEAVHPDRSAICPASVVSVLDPYFFRVQIDDSTTSWLSSLEDPNILPYGWCRQHGLDCSGDDLLPSRPATPGEEAAEPGTEELETASPRQDGSVVRTPPRGEEGEAPPPDSPESECPPDSQVELIQTEDGLDSSETDGVSVSQRTADLPDSPETGGLSLSQRTADLPDSPETGGLSLSQRTADLPDSPETGGLSLSQQTTGELPDSQPLDSLPASPETEPPSDSQQTGTRPDSPDTETLPDSQQTADIPNSQRTAAESQLTEPLSDSVVSEWLLEGGIGDEGGLSAGQGAGGLGAGEAWLHLSPASDDLLPGQPPAEEESPSDAGDDSFCSREAEEMGRPPPSLGTELLPAAAGEELPEGEDAPFPSGVRPVEEQTALPSEVQPMEESPSSRCEAEPMDTGMPSPSNEAQTGNENTSPADAQVEVQALEASASPPAKIQPSSSPGEAQPLSETSPPSPSAARRPASAGALPPGGSAPSPPEGQQSKDDVPSSSADEQPPEEDTLLPSSDVPSAARDASAAPHQPTEPALTPVPAAPDDSAPPPTDPPVADRNRSSPAPQCGGEPASSDSPSVSCAVDSSTAARTYPVTSPDKLAASPVGPGASLVGPGASPVGPGASPVGPGASPVGPGASPVGPRASLVGPGASPVGPGASPVGPVASPVGHGASPVGPGASPVGPAASPVGGVSSPAVPASLTAGRDQQNGDEDEEDDAPRLQPSDLVPLEPADSAGLPAGSALELVHPEAADRLCAAAVQRTAGHLLWLRLLSTDGAPELIYPHTSDCLFPAGWAAANGAAFQPPRDWRRRRHRSSSFGSQTHISSAADGAVESGAESESESGSGPAEHPAASDSAASTWTGPLYINTACHSGPLLSTNKLVAQPRVVGAGPVRLVARDLLNRLVWAGYHESRVLKHLQCSGPARPGWTNDLIKAKVNNTIYGGVVELPLSREHMAEFCAGLFARLQCCPTLVAPTRYPVDTCPHRCRTTLRPAQQANRPADLPSAESGPALLRERLGPAKRPRPEYLHALEPPTRRRRGRPPKWLAESAAAAAATSSGAQEPPSSPDTGRPALYQVTLEKNPRLWDAADLARYLQNTECAHLVPGLLRQEVDGVSFMLLTCSTLTEVLELSERDAVALCTHVSRVKYTYFTAFSG